MKKFLVFAALAALLSSCEDKIMENYPLWTPNLSGTRGDGTIVLQWVKAIYPYCSIIPPKVSEPQLFEIYLSKGDSDHFEKVATVNKGSDYTITLDNLENGTQYFAEVKATAGFRDDVTSNRVMLVPGLPEQVERIETDGNIYSQTGSLSHDARFLAYTDPGFTWGNGQYGNTALFSLDLDALTTSLVDTGAYFPDWSPAGPELVFCTDEHEITQNGYRPQQIAVYHAQDGTISILTSGEDFNANPEFSPDGNRIVYSSDAGHRGSFEIWTMAKDGSQQTQISHNLLLSGWTYGGIGLGRPVWSSDMNFIYLNLFREAAFDMDICRIPAGGGEVETVIHSPWNDYIPAISPDNSRMAFVSNRCGINQIWLYEFATERFSQVTGDGHFYVMDYWGKLEWVDDNTILFSGYEYGTSAEYGIFMVEIQD